jgi:hypothetical protein
MILSKFINEIGNKIKIRIKNQKDTGTNYKTKEKIIFNGVSISMIGPTSISENVFTYSEVEELYFTLKKFLNK